LIERGSELTAEDAESAEAEENRLLRCLIYLRVLCAVNSDAVVFAVAAEH
jgi:hypothetical protein